jgi:hypothetical protein
MLDPASLPTITDAALITGVDTDQMMLGGQAAPVDAGWIERQLPRNGQYFVTFSDGGIGVFAASPLLETLATE